MILLLCVGLADEMSPRLDLRVLLLGAKWSLPARNVSRMLGLLGMEYELICLYVSLSPDFWLIVFSSGRYDRRIICPNSQNVKPRVLMLEVQGCCWIHQLVDLETSRNQVLKTRTWWMDRIQLFSCLSACIRVFICIECASKSAWVNSGSVLKVSGRFDQGVDEISFQVYKNMRCLVWTSCKISPASFSQPELWAWCIYDSMFIQNSGPAQHHNSLRYWQSKIRCVHGEKEWTSCR